MGSNGDTSGRSWSDTVYQWASLCNYGHNLHKMRYNPQVWLLPTTTVSSPTY